MLNFNLNCFSVFAELEKQGDVSHAVKSFLVLHLLSLFKTYHFLLSTQSNYKLIGAIFKNKCIKNCLSPPVEQNSGMEVVGAGKKTTVFLKVEFLVLVKGIL